MFEPERGEHRGEKCQLPKCNERGKKKQEIGNSKMASLQTIRENPVGGEKWWNQTLKMKRMNFVRYSRENSIQMQEKLNFRNIFIRCTISFYTIRFFFLRIFRSAHSVIRVWPFCLLSAGMLLRDFLFLSFVYIYTHTNVYIDSQQHIFRL